MRETGALGDDQVLWTARGERAFAAGDRVMFLRNERSFGVKNGTLGTVQAVDPSTMSARLDDGRFVALDLKIYADLDHGYATTIHKSQGVTVDQSHVLASRHMDRHSTYVAPSRHRDRVMLHYDQKSFADEGQLAQTLGRERVKDTTLDYSAEFSERRDIRGNLEKAVSERQTTGGMFANFKPRTPGSAHLASHERRDELEAASQAFAHAFADAERMRTAGLPVLEHQRLLVG